MTSNFVISETLPFVLTLIVSCKKYALPDIIYSVVVKPETVVSVRSFNQQFKIVPNAGIFKEKKHGSGYFIARVTRHLTGSHDSMPPRKLSLTKYLFSGAAMTY